MIDPLISLAHSICSNRGVYALLLGSGLSRAAGIPTGWEITLELVRRVAAADGVTENLADPEAWFRETRGIEPSYSNLLDELARSPAERRGILHRFISPTPTDIEAGVKVPTEAHRAIARLVAAGFIRIIVTTNFDRLLETALRDVGVEPTVIASADAVAGAMPLTHSGCVVIKLHGDYLDTRIRNTPAELAKYPPRLQRYLARIVDEFGLVVVGWSAEWDEALRAAIVRSPTRRFTTWWTARGGRVADLARSVVDQRGAQVISITDADSFFASLEQKVLAIEDLSRPHPLSAKVAVAELKRYLPEATQRIRQHDLVLTVLRDAIAQTERLDTQGLWSDSEFRRRLDFYEAASEILRPLLATGARWCREEDEAIWCDAVRHSAQSFRHTAGLGAWVVLQRYFPMLSFYAVGLGATAGDRYRMLRRLFAERLRFEHEVTPPENLLPYTAFQYIDISQWNALTAPSGSLTPVSNRLLAMFKRDVPDLAGSESDYDDLFDRFEIMAAMALVDQTQDPKFDPKTLPWMPPGRYVWRIRHRQAAATERWLADADVLRDKWPPIAAGLFGGSYTRFEQIREALRLFVQNSRW